ncbi:hypothetical protein Poly21_57200 [Allorhodopirellula heiligendammensis]|uniref:Uncharacterized protein n=1 Tax=Allorhodopirellula heiligendammensis TaxID=2714739 RepID=A0A5C6B1L8_9BACT|nr:hypothetical protein Poly21_57200 [Allorhodopirellula heiligendammensis]
MHHRKSQAIDGEDRSQKLQTIANPSTTVLIRFPSQRIVSTEKRPADASLDAMDHLNLRRIKNFPTSLTRHHINSNSRNIRAAAPLRQLLSYASGRSSRAKIACPFLLLSAPDRVKRYYSEPHCDALFARGPKSRYQVAIKGMRTAAPRHLQRLRRLNDTKERSKQLGELWLSSNL